MAYPVVVGQNVQKNPCGVFGNVVADHDVGVRCCADIDANSVMEYLVVGDGVVMCYIPDNHAMPRLRVLPIPTDGIAPDHVGRGGITLNHNSISVLSHNEEVLQH